MICVFRHIICDAQVPEIRNASQEGLGLGVLITNYPSMQVVEWGPDGGGGSETGCTNNAWV